MARPTSSSRWRSWRWRRSSRTSSPLPSENWSACMRLIVVRHGATVYNAEARFTGQTDAPLSAHGVRQSHALAERLQALDCATIVSSDLLRATQTAEAIVATHPTVTVRLDADLREIALGAWEGLTYAEVRERQPEALARWQR